MSPPFRENMSLQLPQSQGALLLLLSMSHRTEDGRLDIGVEWERTRGRIKRSALCIKKRWEVGCGAK